MADTACSLSPSLHSQSWGPWSAGLVPHHPQPSPSCFPENTRKSETQSRETVKLWNWCSWKPGIRRCWWLRQLPCCCLGADVDLWGSLILGSHHRSVLGFCPRSQGFGFKIQVGTARQLVRTENVNDDHEFERLEGEVGVGNKTWLHTELNISDAVLSWSVRDQLTLPGSTY